MSIWSVIPTVPSRRATTTNQRPLPGQLHAIDVATTTLVSPWFHPETTPKNTIGSGLAESLIHQAAEKRSYRITNPPWLCSLVHEYSLCATSGSKPK
jgi:hypothetical protein